MSRSSLSSSAHTWALTIVILALALLLLDLIRGSATPTDGLTWSSGSADAPVVTLLLNEQEWAEASVTAQRHQSASLSR